MIEKANSLLSQRYKQIRPLSKEEVISQLPLLGYMDCEDIQLSQICSNLLSASKLLVYYKNDVIINEGEMSNGIYIILNGLVSFSQQQHPYQLYHNDESMKSMSNLKSVKSIRDDKDYIDLFTYPKIYTLDNHFNNIIHESIFYLFYVLFRIEMFGSMSCISSNPSYYTATTKSYKAELLIIPKIEVLNMLKINAVFELGFCKYIVNQVLKNIYVDELDEYTDSQVLLLLFIIQS